MEYIHFSEDNVNVHDRYGPENKRKINEAIFRFVSAEGNEWTDIFSQKTQHHKVSVNPSNIDGVYKAAVTKNEFPIINFIIIQYGPTGENSTEVVFGWGHHATDRVDHVFTSRDHKIVEMFFHYYDVLVNEAEWVRSGDPGSKRSDQVVE